jgi:hypothetical protein
MPEPPQRVEERIDLAVRGLSRHARATARLLRRRSSWGGVRDPCMREARLPRQPVSGRKVAGSAVRRLRHDVFRLPSRASAGLGTQPLFLLGASALHRALHLRSSWTGEDHRRRRGASVLPVPCGMRPAADGRSCVPVPTLVLDRDSEEVPDDGDAKADEALA